MTTSIKATFHYGNTQSMIMMKNPTKLFESWKAFCMLFHALNSTYTVKYQVDFTNATPATKESFVEKSTPNPLKFFMSTVSCHTFSEPRFFLALGKVLER